MGKIVRQQAVLLPVLNGNYTMDGSQEAISSYKGKYCSKECQTSYYPYVSWTHKGFYQLLLCFITITVLLTKKVHLIDKVNLWAWKCKFNTNRKWKFMWLYNITTAELGILFKECNFLLKAYKSDKSKSSSYVISLGNDAIIVQDLPEWHTLVLP